MKKNFVVIFFVMLVVIMKANDEGKTRLIVRMDDIGCAQSATQACIDAYKDGIGTCVEIMAPCPWFLDAVEALKNNPELEVGVHLVLTSEWENYKWGPITHAPSLVDENGYFFPKENSEDPDAKDAFWTNMPDMNEVEAELRAQIELAIKHLPNITHVSGHMGIDMDWTSQEMVDLVREIAKDYDLDIRTDDYGVEYMWDPLGNRNLTWQERETIFIKNLRELKKGKTYIMFEHPSYDTPEMRGMGHEGYTNVAHDRETATKVLKSDKVKKVIEEEGIELINYMDLTK